jgi:hypothetical protein
MFLLYPSYVIGLPPFACFFYKIDLLIKKTLWGNVMVIKLPFQLLLSFNLNIAVLWFKSEK